MRKTIVAGNWKMHKGLEETKKYLEFFLKNFKSSSSYRVLIAPPFPLIAPMVELVDDKIEIGAQNMHQALEGAFTGEVSASLLKEIGASFVILGHSERRQLFHEEGFLIADKIRTALLQGLQPIICIGETLEEREKGKMKEVLEKQLFDLFSTFTASDALKTMVAYEPIWAIGTGKTATPVIAEETHLFCRSVLEELFGKEIALQIPLLYGGSVKPEHMKELMVNPNIDGVLVGGASLNPESFLQIIENSVI